MPLQRWWLVIWAGFCGMNRSFLGWEVGDGLTPGSEGEVCAGAGRCILVLENLCGWGRWWRDKRRLDCEEPDNRQRTPGIISYAVESHRGNIWTWKWQDLICFLGKQRWWRCGARVQWIESGCWANEEKDEEAEEGQCKAVTRWQWEPAKDGIWHLSPYHFMWGVAGEWDRRAEVTLTFLIPRTGG